MDPARTLSLMFDPSLILQAQGLTPDPWQRDALFCADRQIILNCSRGAGKSRTIAAKAVHAALFEPPALVVILAPSQRQSGELFRYVKDAYNAIDRPAGALVENQSTLELKNKSRIVCLPGKEGTVRSFQGVRLLTRHPNLTRKAVTIEEVVAHPLVDILNRPNPYHGSFDLWELTTLYQEVHGTAYWSLEMDPVFGVPKAVYILPSQNMTPLRAPDSPRPIDYFRYRTGAREQLFDPADVVFFKYPDPRDPYTAGLSPLRACFEQVALASSYAAFKSAKFENHGVPDAVVSPDEIIGEEERDRLEAQWQQRFRKGGTGRVVVAESGLKVQLLQQSMGDLAALAEQGVTKELIANAFHVPVAFWTTSTNLANLTAARGQHSDMAIAPRLTRRDETLNAALVPLFDPDGRLFLSSDPPESNDIDATTQQLIADLQNGVLTINDVRTGRGLPPVPWGDQPWLNTHWAQADQLRERGAPPLSGKKN